MARKVVHIFFEERKQHGFPFSVCDKHLKVVESQYTSPQFRVSVVGPTTSVCETCQKEESIARPLRVILKHKDSFTFEELKHLVQGLGYRTIDDAWKQLRSIDPDADVPVPVESGDGAPIPY